MGEHTAEKDVPRECGVRFAVHPSKPHLVAVCTLVMGHYGQHDNRLPKRVNPPASSAQPDEDGGTE